jgi:hypothetical protein
MFLSDPNRVMFKIISKNIHVMIAWLCRWRFVEFAVYPLPKVFQLLFQVYRD